MNWHRIDWRTRLWWWRFGMTGWLLAALLLRYGVDPENRSLTGIVSLCYAGFMAVAWGGLTAQYRYWMGRSPGGIRGWRPALLCLPGINLLWNFVETPWLTWSMARQDKRVFQLSAGLFAWFSAWLAAFWTVFAAVWLIFPEEEALSLLRRFDFDFRLLLVFFASWWFAFEMWAGMLNNSSQRYEFQPTSRRKRHLQFWGVIMLAVALPLVVVSIYAIVRCRQFAQLKAAYQAGHSPVRTTGGRFSLDMGQWQFPAWGEVYRADYLHPRVEAAWRRDLEAFRDRMDGITPEILVAGENSELRMDCDFWAFRYMTCLLMETRFAMIDGDRERLEECLRLADAVSGMNTTLYAMALKLLDRLTADGGLELLPDQTLAWLQQESGLLGNWPEERERRERFRAGVMGPFMEYYIDAGEMDLRTFLLLSWALPPDELLYLWNSCHLDDWALEPGRLRETYERRERNSIESRRRLALVAVAAERFRRRNGRWPADAAELQPAFLAEIPVSPLDGLLPRLTVIPAAGEELLLAPKKNRIPTHIDSAGRLIKPRHDKQAAREFPTAEYQEIPARREYLCWEMKYASQKIPRERRRDDCR